MSAQLSLGDLIRGQRAALGLTQARLAELVGRSPSTIRSWERDRSLPADDATLAALVAVLGLEDDEVADALSHQPESEAGDGVETTRPDAVLAQEADTGIQGELTEESAVRGSVMPPAPSEDAGRGAVSEPGRGSGSITAPASTSAGPDDTRRGPVISTPPPGRPIADERTELTTPPEPAPVPGFVSVRPRMPSYLDDPAELRIYRARTILTAVLLVLLLIVLSWAFGEAREAFDSLFGDPGV